MWRAAGDSPVNPLPPAFKFNYFSPRSRLGASTPFVLGDEEVLLQTLGVSIATPQNSQNGPFPISSP